jgi:phosphonopyruvate decarboxylase
MVDPQELFESFSKVGVSLYAGVPDSLLKPFCAYVSHRSHLSSEVHHVITANEGSAVALAAGHFLATNELAVVYMQNSGLGNAINPLASLVAPSVYGIPLLLLVGWRGEPGKRDEPQHLLQGEKTIALLQTFEIPFGIIDALTDVQKATKTAATIARAMSCPYAFVIREKTFTPYPLHREKGASYPLSREEALKVVLGSIGEAVVVSTTGMASRELFEYRERRRQKHDTDFLTVGSMGHTSQIALGVALRTRHKEVYCLDGDGAAIMHMGSLAIIGSTASRNFRHIILNNGAHDSVGGQPTVGFKIDFCGIASACGYVNCCVAQTENEISEAIEALHSIQGPTLLEIRVRTGAREDLGRPTVAPSENKTHFMDFLRK